jgi:hypothetical protein
LTSLLLAAIGPAIGGLITLTGAVIVFKVSNKSAERRHREQLLHEDKKKAIRQLHQLLDSKEGTPWQWSQKITEFLHSFDGSYVPEELRSRVRNEMQNLESKIEAAFPDDFVGEEELSIEEEQEALLDELGPEGLEIDEKRTKLRAELERLAVSFATNPTQPKIQRGPSVPPRRFRVLRRLGKNQSKG